MKKILVIDGNSIINRAYYGVRPLSTKSGKPTNAIFGMVNIISRQLSEISPDYAAVAFDVKHPTFRHEMYSEYKAGRHPTPEDLLAQFPDAKECLSAMGLHVLELPGWEADDIQGTIASFAKSTEDTESYILTGDRDLLQLIDKNIGVLLVTNSDTHLMKRDEFFEKYKIEPEQFVDMKALMGDSSDNIPGVAGVGEKTAQALIQNFGSLDGIYENIEDSRISKGVREKLLRSRDMAYLSQRLARINTEAPIDKPLSELEYHGFDKKRLFEKFSELELNSFIVKFGLTASDCQNDESAEVTTERVCYREVSAQELLSIKEKKFATQLIDASLYINIKEENLCYRGDFDKVKDIFSDKDVLCYDAKSLCHTLGLAPEKIKKTRFLDLMLYAYVLNPGGKNTGVNTLLSSFAGIHTENGTPCVEHLSLLEEKMLEKVKADGLSGLLFDIEIPLINLLYDIECRGFKINKNGIVEFGAALAKLAEELKYSIYEKAGTEFNINSPKQLGEVLFVKLGLPFNKKKKNGYSTDAETLEELRATSPIIDDILEYRQVTKLHSTYALPLAEVCDENDRIHTDFKQALTATGRLSSAEPNLQNIPIRTKLGREFRRYFIAKEGYTLVDADYSQIELRILAHISDDYTMREAFISGEDIHTGTASAVFGVMREDVTPEMRKRAKAVNFGIIYGIGGYSLAKDIGTTTAEANSYIKNYLMNYPGIDRYLTDVVEEAKETGYTKTPFGRRRYIPELTAANGMLRAFGKRVAMNAPIQGAAADIMKLAMLRVANRLDKEGIDGGIVMQVHDELVIEVRSDMAELCSRIVKEEMENAVKLSVPMTVDVTTGKNWLEQE